MKKIILTLLICISLSLGAKEKTLYTKDLIRLVSENNSSVQISAAGTQLAKSIYDQTIKSARPGIFFSTDTFSSPLYGYNNNTTFGITPITESHTVSAGITVEQLLPTGGTASLALSDSLVYERSSSNDPWELSQDPGLEFSLFQPVLVNGSFIDFSAMKNTKRSSQIPYEVSRISNMDTRNQTINAVISEVHRINVLRKSRDIMEKGIALAKLKAEMAREDRDRGRISTSDLISIELDVGRQHEILFDLGYQLTLAEMNLGRMLGIEDVSGISFNLSSDSMGIRDSGGKAVEKDFNPGVLKASLDVEQKEIRMSLNNLKNAPLLNVFFQTGPRYPEPRDDSADISSSLTDLFSSEADIDLSFGFSVQMNLWDGGVTKSRKEADQLAIGIARQKLEDASSEAKGKIKALNYRIKLLNEKETLLNANIEYDTKLLQREIDRQKIGSSTNVDVETVRMEVLSIERDLLDVKGQQYITFLQIKALQGKNVSDFILNN